MSASTFLLALGLAQEASADCNVVPGTINAYPGNQGSSNSPFASPGDEVAISVAPGSPDAPCDTGAGLPGSEADTLVTIVFTPPDGPERAVLLTEGPSCPANALSSCTTALGANNVLCVPNDDVVREDLVPSGARLRFRFPDSHALLAPGDPNPLHTLAGPAKIAVNSIAAIDAAAETAPCAALAAGGCSAATGTRACVGELYEVDGTCERGSEHRDSSFSHFTALPIPSNYQALCETPGTPCVDRGLELPGQLDQIRFTVDADGNVLWPVNWEGILVGGAVPIPRIVQGSIELAAKAGDPDPMSIPKFGFLSAYSLQGHRLPPVFAPLGNPNAAGSVFGTADSPRGVLRIARRSSSFEQCAGGDRSGLPCSEDDDCPNGGSCGATTCQGGVNQGDLCASDLQCPGSECGPSLYEFRDRNDGLLASLDTAGLGLIAESDFVLDARNPVPLDGLVETPDLLLEVRSEPSESANAGTPVDLNADGDSDDVAVVTMRDRLSGATQNIGASGSPGRAVPRVRQSLYTSPAATAEGDVIAFLEAEQLQGSSASCLVPPLGPGCDKNGDADSGDTLLRVYRLGEGVIAGDPAAPASAQITADPAPIVSGGSLAVSEGQVFLRGSETAAAARIETTIISLPPLSVVFGDMSEDGRFLVFLSEEDIPPNDFNGHPDVFTYDRDPDGNGVYDESGSLSIVPVNGTASGVGAPAITPDGRFVVFTHVDAGTSVRTVAVHDRTSQQTFNVSSTKSYNTNQAISDDGRFVALRIEETPCCNTTAAFHDRDVDQDGVFDEPGAVLTTIIPNSNGSIIPFTPIVSISGDGRWIAFDSDFAFTYPLDIVTSDTNNDSDVVVMDLATLTPRRMSVSTQGAESVLIWCDDECYNRLSSISRDGRFVSFTSAAENLGASSFPFQMLVRDRDPDGNTIFDERGAITREVTPSIGVSESVGGVMSPDGRYVPRRKNGVSVVDRVTGLHDAGQGATTWAGHVVAEGGRFVAGGRDTIRVRGIDTSTVATAAADRNADGDAFDTLLGVIDTADLSPAVEWLGAAGQVEVTDGNAVFLLPEVEDPAGPDLNQDGDSQDYFVRLYRKGQAVADLGRAARRVALSNRYVAAIGWRPEQGVPVNMGEPTVAVYPVDGSAGWTDLDLPAADVAAAGDWVAFRVPEPMLGVDLNGDDDSGDHVLHFYDASAGGPVVNTAMAAEEFVLGERIIAFRVSEAAQDAELNGDSDQLDAVLFVVDLADPESDPFNTEQAALACPFEACDGRHPYRISGETVTFLTREEDQGADLNGDLDSSDVLLQHFNAVSMALQSSPGAATSQFAAAPAGVCTDTGESCVSDVACPAGECIVPPGQCEVIIGGSCEADADGPHCAAGQFCRPFGEGVAGTCVKFLGPCDRQADCVVFAVCRNTGQDAQRLESPLDPYADGRQGLVSGGVCIETLAASCSDDEDCVAPAFCSGGSCRLQSEPCVTAADCAAGAACVQNLVLAGDSDADGDFVAASIDNCPKHPNTDQADVDVDRVGDRCDLQTCGDGVQQFAEQCDDGNTVAGDECDNACHLVLGPGGCAVGELMLEAACSNGADDDGDGLVDHPEDGGCDGVCDTSERRDVSDAGPPRACDDGKDNDGDQLVDWPTDPGCLTPSSPLENPACSNGIDDDADGVLDSIDGGCGDPSDRSEGADCSDGIDNDGDGQVDHPADTHCTSPAGASEAPFCSDGLDNDGDGALDFPADPGCTSALDDDERGPTLACDDGVDGDGDGAADFPHDPGCATLTDPTETDPALVCDNGLDDDTDGAIDFPDDPGCASWTDTNEQLATAQCDDGLDHDGDALVDTDDPDCSGPDDPTEFHLSPNDLLVNDNLVTGKVVRVNPVSGAQTLVWESSDFFNVLDLAIDSNGDVYIIEAEKNAVLRLDLEAGTQQVVSLGGHLSAPLSIDAEPRGTLVVTEQTGDKVLRIDPRTGAQQVLYAGLPLEQPSGISVEADGRIIVSDITADALFRLDPTTGSITTLAAPASWTAPRMIDVEPEGNILVVDQAPTDEIYRVTPTGTLTLLSSGAPYNDTRGVVRLGTLIFITDIGADAIFKFPSTGGVATTLSSGGFLGAPRGIEAVPATQCSDSLDNDGDGLTNLADPDCSGALDRTEFNLAVGDLVVANFGQGSIDGSIVRVKPSGGAQTLLSADPRFEALEGIRFDARGRILVSDSAQDAVFRFDPVSGRVETLARGGALDAPSGIAVEAGGTLLVASALEPDAIARVQPETGLATLVTGPVFADPNGIEIEAAGTWLVADGTSDTIERVNPLTGVPTVLADAADGLDHPFYLEIEPGTGNVLVAERDDGELSRLTLASGAVTSLASGFCGAGRVPRDVALDANGDAIVTCDRNAQTSGDKLVRIDLPGSAATTISTDLFLRRVIGLAIVKAACADGLDNDGDGLTDHPADPGCANAGDGTETNPAVACDDGLDNDLDLFVDFPADPGCGSATATTEDADCSDGEDNDGDGQTDHPADSGCASPADLVETNAAAACDDGLDNDGDGLVDHPADPGCASPSDASETSAAAACDDGVDNDGDGFADFPDDPGCGAATDSSERTPSYACDDGLDNDGDGTADEPADPGCVGPTDASERQTGGPACDDGLDNDADSYFDYPADPGCQNAAATLEKRQCQDGLNNDNQSGIDFDGGASLDLDDNGFIDAAFNPGTPAVGAADPQCMGQGWRGAEKIGCGLGFELAPILAFLLARRRRRAA